MHFITCSRKIYLLKQIRLSHALELIFPCNRTGKSHYTSDMLHTHYFLSGKDWIHLFFPKCMSSFSNKTRSQSIFNINKNHLKNSNSKVSFKLKYHISYQHFHKSGSVRFNTGLSICTSNPMIESTVNDEVDEYLAFQTTASQDDIDRTKPDFTGNF